MMDDREEPLLLQLPFPVNLPRLVCGRCCKPKLGSMYMADIPPSNDLDLPPHYNKSQDHQQYPIRHWGDHIKGRKVSHNICCLMPCQHCWHRSVDSMYGWHGHILRNTNMSLDNSTKNQLQATIGT